MEGKINREGSSPTLFRKAASIYLLLVDGVAFGDILVVCKLMVCCISQATPRQKLGETAPALAIAFLMQPASADTRSQTKIVQIGKSRGTIQCR